MPSRRQFISDLSWGVGVLTLAPAIVTARTLRVASIVEPGQRSLATGVAFGAAEAERSATLFGWRVEHAPWSSKSDGVDALVSGSRAPAGMTMPVLCTVCGPERASNVLSLAACASSEERAENRRVVVWHPSLERFGAEQLNARFTAFARMPMDGDAWMGWFALKVIVETTLRVGSTDADRMLAYMRRPTTGFDGHKGMPLRFDERGQLVQPLYELRASGNGWSVEREIPPNR